MSEIWVDRYKFTTTYKNSLNKCFKGSEFHHFRMVDKTGFIDHTLGLYIPKEIHCSIRHAWAAGLNMREINNAALGWYIQTTDTTKINSIALELHKKLLSYNLNKYWIITIY